MIPSPPKPKTNNEGQNAFAAHLATIRIMIVVSSGPAAHLIQKLFENLGFSQLYIARDAMEAVAFLRDVSLHLIVTDSDLKVNRIESAKTPSAAKGMIELSGLQFAHRLRVSPSSPAPFIPILMLMDHAKVEDIMKARDVGVNEIILKPLEARNFCQRIIDLIDNPRNYITAETYKGPCRRRREDKREGSAERRRREIRLVRSDETNKVR